MSHEVEFVGGPLDGLVQPFTHSPDRLPSTTALPVNPSLLRFLFMDGGQHAVRGPATSVAVYQLQQAAQRLRYWHLQSVSEVRSRLPASR